jgi:hypothetical protein
MNHIITFEIILLNNVFLGNTNTGQNRGYRRHIGHPSGARYVPDVSTISLLHIHIGYPICVVLMRKIGHIYYRYQIHILKISGIKISGICRRHIGLPIYYNKYRTNIGWI